MVLCFLVIIPSAYTSPTPATSVNGSSATGNCASSTSGTITCADQASSVLFDGHIPILTGLDGNTWASQLLTIQTTAEATSVDITFDFHDTPDFTTVERVEVVMFNCPQWGIGVETIAAIEHLTNIRHNTVNITSCDSLVRVCIPFRATTPTFTLQLLGS